MFSDAVVLDLIGLIYDAAGKSEVWPTFLEKMCNLISAHSANIGYLDPQSVGSELAYVFGMNSSDVQLYNTNYSYDNVWTDRAPKEYWTPSFVGLSHHICSDGEFEKSEFYCDFARPIGFYYGMTAVVLSEGSRLSSLSIVREKSKGPFEPEEALLVKRLVPHLQRAMALHQRIGRVEATGQSVVDLFDLLPTGLGLADQQGRICMLNRRARSIIDQSDGLTIRQGQLYASLSGETKHLHTLLRRAGSTGAGNDLHPGGVMTISRPSLRRPFGILVSPLRPSSAWLGREQPRAAIFITDPETETERQDQVLARLFGLTPAEARLADALMHGKSLREAAEQFGVTRNTVHSQLQKIFEKTGTNRQSELLRLILKSSFHLK